MRDLQLMNVTPATLFPDLYGAAWQANIANANIHFASLMYTGILQAQIQDR